MKTLGLSTAHLLDWPKSENLTTPNGDKKVEQQELSAVGNANWYRYYGRQFGNFSKKKKKKLNMLNMLLPYNSAVTLLAIYPNELKTHVHANVCTQMFIAALLLIAKT